MSLKEFGEFGFIRYIDNAFSTIPQNGIKGIGDDCAVIPIGEEESFVVTTDMLTEGSHFLPGGTPPYDLGWKSLAVNLSDIAAMGAAPVASFLSVALTDHTDPDWCKSFIEGFRELSAQFGVPLCGGDTTFSKHALTISVTVIGKAKNSRIKYRNTARVGDIIATTGQLGNSAGGLQLILDNTAPTTDAETFLIQCHNRPIPHIKEGVFLSAYKEVHAMMDISDGIASDLRHICNASKCSAAIRLPLLPLSDALKETAARKGWSLEQMALCTGEDYRLLLTIDPAGFDTLNNAYQATFGTPLYPIGTITAGSEASQITYTDDQQREVLLPNGFTHF